jgi:D-alanyl-D-alanine carboxypeptidase (penicillin-binding protein 5/6)
VDYQIYISDIVITHTIENALEVNNPEIEITAVSAIMFDANTKEVLFYKDPVEPIFPASTAKLLTALVALEWCQEDELITVGDEIKMIASDSSKAGLRDGQVLTLHNLLEAMLLPSGNDAAYVTATYIGRKSLKKTDVSNEDAVIEFMRLANDKAKKLGAINSCFKTPDGYDAIGQYTTAYDMGMIGLAAAENSTIISISNKGSSSNTFASGEEITWNNTNSLVRKGSNWYYSPAIGLKTGTTTMAGRCLIAVATDGDNKVVCAIMNSSTTGRYKDALAILNYGLYGE